MRGATNVSRAVLAIDGVRKADIIDTIVTVNSKERHIMLSLKRRGYRGLVLSLFCVLFLLLCFGWHTGQIAGTTQTTIPQRAGIAFDMAQKEQPVDYAVKPYNQSPQANSPLTLRQTHHLLAIAVSLILLVLIGCYSAYPAKLNVTCIFVTSWHLLRAPPKTETYGCKP